jgi:hypothetical protein
MRQYCMMHPQPLAVTLLYRIRAFYCMRIFSSTSARYLRKVVSVVLTQGWCGWYMDEWPRKDAHCSYRKRMIQGTIGSGTDQLGTWAWFISLPLSLAHILVPVLVLIFVPILVLILPGVQPLVPILVLILDFCPCSHSYSSYAWFHP